MLEGRDRVGERVARLHQRPGVDAARGEQRDRRRERPAARADDRDLVHDEARQVHLRLAVVGALQHDRAAGAHGASGELEAVRVPRALDDQVGAARLDPVGGGRRDPAGGEEGQRSRAAADDEQLAARHGQRLRDEVAELARADHHDRVAGRDLHLLLQLEGRGGGLGEDGHVVGHRVRHGVQVLDRQPEVRREGPVPGHDAQHGPLLAVRAPAGPAGRARAAGGVDLAGDTAADPLGRAARRLDRAHELVAGHARVGVVAAHELQVGVAHARDAHAHERLARRRHGGGEVVAHAQRLRPRARGLSPA